MVYGSEGSIPITYHLPKLILLMIYCQDFALPSCQYLLLACRNNFRIQIGKEADCISLEDP